MGPMTTFLHSFRIYGIPDFGAIDMHIAEFADRDVLFGILSQMMCFLLESHHDVCLIGPKSNVRDVSFR